MLHKIDEGLWERNDPLRILGMPLGHRMTVARLADGSLWVHSPVAYSVELAASLDTLGPVAHVVAPNYMHDTYLEGWLSQYPGVRFHAPPRFERVFPHHPATDRLGENAPAAWVDVFDQHVIRGVPRLHEVVFRHRASRTLILTDLAFNLDPAMPWLSRCLCQLNGCYDRFTPSRMFKAVISDRAALRSSIDHLLGWDFDRIIVSHGRTIETGGPAALRAAFAFLG